MKALEPRSLRRLCAAVLMFGAGCGGSGGAPATDGGATLDGTTSRDAPVHDGEAHDTGAHDTGAHDTGAHDTGAHDTGADAPVHDGGAPDAGAPETGSHDTGAPDVDATTDAGDGGHSSSLDAGPSDAAHPEDAHTDAAPPLPPLPTGTGTGATYYISPSGDDANTGLGQTAALAWKTVANLDTMTFGPGDTVLLEGGQTFSGCVTLTSTHVKSTPTAPFTIGSYGTGTFTLAATCSGTNAAAISVNAVNGFYLHDCAITGNAGGAEYGVFLANGASTTPTGGTRVEACDISGFYSTSATSYGAEIFVAGEPGPLAHVYLLDNTLHGSSGPTSKDDNGISGYGHVGAITDALYQGNVVYDVGGGKPGVLAGSLGNCILAIGIDGGLVQYNVAHACGGNTTTCGGPGGIWTYGSNNVVLQYNEAYGIKPAGVAPVGACDWNGFDLDGQVTNSTLQYNFSHDNYGVGFLTFINGTWSGNTIRYNISQNDGRSIALGGLSGTTPDLAVYGNTLYSDVDGGLGFEMGLGGDGGSVGGHVFDNVLFMAGKETIVDIAGYNKATYSALDLVGNDYYAPVTFDIAWGGKSYTSLAAWAAATGEETRAGAVVGKSVDPQLTAPGTVGVVGGYKPASLGAYRLQPGSPMVGVGLAPGTFSIDGGSHDYFGGPVPGSVGSGYNVGADGEE